MARTQDLLIEIGTEELPPKALRHLSEAFAQGIAGSLAKAGVAHSAVRPYATPRRLAVMIESVAGAQPDSAVEKRGPAVAAAFDEEGNPTKAALGFAGSCGVAVEALETLETDKGAWLIYRTREAGRPTSELLPEIVQRALAALPIPKRMRWGAGSVEFVRPVHWVVLLMGEQVVEAEVLGVPSGRHTRGHRFHHPEPLYLADPAAYAPLLESEGVVMADFSARREAIEAQVIELAASLGGKALMDEALLEEVTALVEWPTALAGQFEARFLELPAECLVSTMKGNQKYFPVAGADGQLLAHFITVSNIRSSDPTQVITGNERVIRPRLADAAFFWEQDRKHALADRLAQLKSVVFQERLGTLYDKAARTAELAASVAESIGGEARLAHRAALLAKCDLLTDMVGEFPELQGIMGRYYAAADGEPPELASAMTEQYQPRFAGDAVPDTATGRALAIADKIDTLVGIFGIGEHPSGDKDPYALRRAGLGVLRILIEGGLDLDLQVLLQQAAAAFGGAFEAEVVSSEVYDFMMERLRAYYAEIGIGSDVFEAVLARRPARPHDFDRRIRAVNTFRELPEAASLAAANKRIRNILRKAADPIPDHVDTSGLGEPAEKSLAANLKQISDTVAPLLAAADYAGALTRLAGLREAVDRFFDEVMVMSDDAAARRNRLALLATLSGLFLRVADLSHLQV